ncbi:alpha/beta hydrolase [Jiella sp. MQZ9-1]|uniref:Alpha/beta fold hydrolase n=1 Tax=Jiella flava TaxID=2816857 RepID=A0A939FWE2_9HYPH|nr:alpha/beta fold hydrolase [Jiella flava]MBO0661405.1 alpha/beta fold hydrolase [Jiella flava]MCD2470049.1 alpha/beta hydrolase [Jiella flava]
MILRIVFALVLLLAIVLGGLWLFGPREPVDLTVHFDPTKIGSDADAYLAREEANIPNLRPWSKKEIIWAYPKSRAKTPLSVVYIHGFSADKAETRPLADEVAKALKANLFYTRLSGHGRDGAAMEQVSVNDWVNDLAEAMAIGRDIGSKVIVIGTSTGGTLATLGTTLPGMMKDTEGLVLVSPNFAINDRWAFLLDMPFARKLLPLIGGKTYGFQPLNEGQAKHWTTRYPIGALAPMAALVRAARNLDLSKAKPLPLLMLYSQQDQVVDPDASDAFVAKWPGPHQVIDVPVSGDPFHHVIAGDILSPKTTSELAERIVAWAEALPDAKATADKP